MVTKFVPWPADSGGKRRSLAVLEELARHGEVTLCAFTDSSSRPDELSKRGIAVRTAIWNPTPWKVLRGLARTRSISAARFWDTGLAEMVRRAAEGADHLQVEYTQLAPYAAGIRVRRRLLDMHNVESSLATSYAAGRAGAARLVYRAEAAALRRLERRALETFDATTVVSEPDLRRLPSSARAVVVPNGWDVTGEPLPPAEDPVAAFVALMGWKPNEDAALWLCEEIWPAVRARAADARLLLVGRDPTERVRAHHDRNGIHVTGTVPDVQPHLRQARIGLAPLRAGGGSRLKVLECLDAGRPVVATSKGIEGLDDLVGNGVVVADEPAQMAAAIAELLTDPARAEDLGRRGRAAVAARHSWTAALAPLSGLLSNVQGDATRGAGS